MLRLVYCEGLKLKRSKIVLFSIFGVFATPFMMLLEALQTHFEHPKQVFTLSHIYDSSLLYVMLLMNMMIYVAITAHLFSREYTERTLKTILPVPISRKAFIASKFLVLFIWTTLLTILTWATILVLMWAYHCIFGLSGFKLIVAVEWLLKFILGSILMFLTISPFAYIAEKTKGFVIPVIVSAVVVMFSAALSNQKFGALYPWTANLFLLNGKIRSSNYPTPVVLGIIGLVSIIGFYSTFRYFYLEDLK